MNWDFVPEALKWAGIVLLAGFICHFGKYLVLHMIKRKKKRRQSELEKARIKPTSKGTHKETVEIISNLEKVKAQAIADRKKAKVKEKAKLHTRTNKNDNYNYANK